MKTVAYLSILFSLVAVGTAKAEMGKMYILDKTTIQDVQFETSRVDVAGEGCDRPIEKVITTITLRGGDKIQNIDFNVECSKLRGTKFAFQLMDIKAGLVNYREEEDRECARNRAGNNPQYPGYGYGNGCLKEIQFEEFIIARTQDGVISWWEPREKILNVSWR